MTNFKKNNIVKILGNDSILYMYNNCLGEIVSDELKFIAGDYYYQIGMTDDFTYLFEKNDVVLASKDERFLYRISGSSFCLRKG